MKLFRILLLVFFGLPAQAQTPIVSRLQTESSEWMNVDFPGTKGNHYVVVSATNTGGPFAPVNTAFTLVNNWTNYVFPVSKKSRENRFYALVLVDPQFEILPLPPTGFRDSDQGILRLKVTTSPYADVTLSGLGIKVGITNTNNANTLLSLLGVYCFTSDDFVASGSRQISDVQKNIADGQVRSFPFSVKGIPTPLVIKKGQSGYIEFFGLSNWSSGSYTITILPDIEIQPLVPQSQVHGMIVWSPSTNAAPADPFWANGHSLPSNLSNTRSY